MEKDLTSLFANPSYDFYFIGQGTVSSSRSDHHTGWFSGFERPHQHPSSAPIVSGRSPGHEVSLFAHVLHFA